MTEFKEMKVDKFTFKVAVDRFYTTQGVWAQVTGNIARIGLSDFFQQRSGDIAFAEGKPEGTVLAVGDEAAAIETIKVNINLASPVAGAIVHRNPLMESAPEMINLDPYGEGWLCEIAAACWEAKWAILLALWLHHAWFAGWLHLSFLRKRRSPFSRKRRSG